MVFICMLSLKCKINGVLLHGNIKNMNLEQEWLNWKSLLFSRLFILPAQWHCISTMGFCKRLGLFLPNHSLLLSYCSGAPCFPGLFYIPQLLMQWQYFSQKSFRYGDTWTHWKRTWLRTFWRLTLALSLFLRLLLCSLSSWWSESGEWELLVVGIVAQVNCGRLICRLRDWIIAEEQLEVTSSLQTALVNRQNLIGGRIWPLMA